MYSLRLVHSRMILEGVQMIIIQILMRQIIQKLEFPIHMKYLEILIARLMKITIKIEFPVMPMGVLAHRLRTLGRSLVPPIA